MTTDIM